jgi:hypothetical protein
MFFMHTILYNRDIFFFAPHYTTTIISLGPHALNAKFQHFISDLIICTIKNFGRKSLVTFCKLCQTL